MHVLTDLSKAFDCINHELLIAKLEAYGFDNDSLGYIYSYLTHRMQRTKVNNSFSLFSNINSDIDSLINTIENDASILMKWFQDNYLKMNEDKCHLLITNQNESFISVNIGNETIINRNSEKLLRITIDNKLTFTEHISIICKNSA